MAKLDNGPARGTRDLLPDAVARRERIVASIARTYERHGFRRIETPSIENIERLTGGQGGENEKLIYKILKRGLPEELEPGARTSEMVDLGLRFDLTVPLTRFYANNQAQLPQPFRALQIGNVWRAERPAKGRYRQFTQCDIDILGEASVLAEAELLEATAAALLELGIAPITVRFNDRRVLGAIADESGVSEEQKPGLFVTLDKLDKIGWDAVVAELAERAIPETVGERLRHLVTTLSSAPDPAVLIDRAADCLPSLPDGVLDGLAATASSLDGLAVHDPRCGYALDPTVVRGMGYYTGQIFEVSHPDSDSSIAGGGRYDGLVGRSLGRDVPACGISIGFERIVELAEVEPVDLGVAILYGDEPSDEILAAARQIRASGSPSALVRRRKALRQQLDGLEAEGYSGFVLLRAGAAAELRRFGAGNTGGTETGDGVER